MTVLKRVQQSQISPNHPLYQRLDSYCFESNLFKNKTNYYMRQVYYHNQANYRSKRPKSENLPCPNWTELEHLVKDSLEYQNLPRKVAQRVIKNLLNDWTSYWAQLVSYWQWKKSPKLKAESPGAFKAPPNPPNYKGSLFKGRADGRSVITFNQQTMSGGRAKVKNIAPTGTIVLCSTSKTHRLEVPFDLHLQDFEDHRTGKKNLIEVIDPDTGEIKLEPEKRRIEINEVRIAPRVGYYLLEVVYIEDFGPSLTSKQKKLQRTAAVDFGSNVLCAMVIEGVNEPLMINGRPLKSVNCFKIKKIGEAKTKLDSCKTKAQKELDQLKQKLGKRVKVKRDKLNKLNAKLYVEQKEEEQAQKKLEKLKKRESKKGKSKVVEPPKPIETTTEPTSKLHTLFNSNEHKLFKAHLSLKLAQKEKAKLNPPIPPYNPDELPELLTPIPEGSSKLVQSMWRRRHNQLKHLLHIASKLIIDTAVENGVTVLILGKNLGQKQCLSRMKNFVQIPFGELIKMITYKAKKVGIKVKLQEESYTSLASAPDMDYLPPKYLGKGNRPPFSGKRKGRLYRTSDGTMIHSDVNGAVNILRKVKTVSQEWVKGVCSTPFTMVNLRVTSR